MENLDGSLMERFKWVIWSARSKNSNVKIISEHFYRNSPSADGDFCMSSNNANFIWTYADSVAKFIETWYHQTLPSVTEVDEVSTRVDGWDMAGEGGTFEEQLSKILVAVHASLNGLGTKLGAPQFSVTNCVNHTGMDRSSQLKCGSVCGLY